MVISKNIDNIVVGIMMVGCLGRLKVMNVLIANNQIGFGGKNKFLTITSFDGGGR